MTEEDTDQESIREQAQSLRDALADDLDAPAEQDEQAARKRAVEDEDDEE